MTKTGSRSAQRKLRIFRYLTCAVLLAFTFLIGDSQFNKAAAQTASFRSVDTNSDGVLSLNELSAAFGEVGARRLLEDIDRNRDNRITILELRWGTKNKIGSSGDRGGRGDRTKGQDDRGSNNEGASERDGDDDRGDDRNDDD